MLARIVELGRGQGDVPGVPQRSGSTLAHHRTEPLGGGGRGGGPDDADACRLHAVARRSTCQRRDRPRTEEPAFGSYIIQASDLNRYVAVLGSSAGARPPPRAARAGRLTPRCRSTAAVSEHESHGDHGHRRGRRSSWREPPTRLGPFSPRSRRSSRHCWPPTDSPSSSTTITPAIPAGRADLTERQAQPHAGRPHRTRRSESASLCCSTRSTRRCATRRTSRWCPVVPCSVTSPSSRIAQERHAQRGHGPARTARRGDQATAHQHPLRRCHDRSAFVRHHLSRAR